MNRRDFIYLSVYTAAASTLITTFSCNHQQIEIEAQPFFFSHLADAQTIALTGLTYRKANTNEDNKSKLSQLILGDNNRQSFSDNEAIRIMLENKVQSDFQTGKIIVVNGWVLSLTEARQCALFSLIHS